MQAKVVSLQSQSWKMPSAVQPDFKVGAPFSLHNTCTLFAQRNFRSHTVEDHSTAALITCFPHLTSPSSAKYQEAHGGGDCSLFRAQHQLWAPVLGFWQSCSMSQFLSFLFDHAKRYLLVMEGVVLVEPMWLISPPRWGEVVFGPPSLARLRF